MTTLESLLEKWNNREQHPGLENKTAISLIEETEEIIRSKKAVSLPNSFWFRFLNATRKRPFLQALETLHDRNRWAEIVFAILRHTNYGLLDMLLQRVAEHPQKVLFKDMSSASPVDWTYEQIFRHLKEIATVFYQTAGEQPRVAFYCENCLEGASTDLACLCYEIFDAPISPHFKSEILLPIFNELKINIALADTEDRLATLQSLSLKTKIPFKVFSLQPPTPKTRAIPYLVSEAKKISLWDIDATLAKRTRKKTSEVATTMFTSGSTGLPKGVSFSIYNMVSKRFARAAALPAVGEEVFLCYLPLFHTFGRYLEMTGSIFWSGTYIFAGNTSAETLLSLFPKMNPTGFISIPLRWQELYERCQEKISRIEDSELREKAVRDVVGTRLHWGLSAAGYLDPAVFRFFNEHGIHLNSGFGMTEATGGITMTPPGQYQDFKVGVPLPGVRTRLTTDSEMELSGHYIGRYLEDAGPGDEIPYPVSPKKDKWLSTGDVFKVSKDGYYEIIDRVKDIYKNNRGQTVAPQVIEKKFHQVPGISKVFLVGDNRPYNVLLIVPDTKDELYQSLSGNNLTEYYHQIVMAANADVAPYERVINFALLDRDFSAEKGELTPKGSFNRKVLENNFRKVVDTLYVSNIVTIEATGITIQIPKWFFRDLGILETDIYFENNRLYNRRTNAFLRFRKLRGDKLMVGDMQYHISSPKIDLGIFTRQPKLWTGNAELTAFCPVKEGWDLDTGNIAINPQVNQFTVRRETTFPVIHSVRDQNLIRVNHLLLKAFYGDSGVAYESVEELGRMFQSIEPRLANTLRYRLESLAYHPEEEIRCLAYRLILLKAPQPEDIPYMPAFIESGLSFLNEQSIREIASSNFGKHRLDALKQRLYWYRTHLKWPASKKTRGAFEDVLEMLYNFAILHLDYYVPIRAELSRWILHRQDPHLSRKAARYFHDLSSVFEKEIERRSAKHAIAEWKSRLVFEHGISDHEKKRITRIFQSTAFLKESITLTFNDPDFDLSDVPEQGIWILRLLAYKEFRHYRMSINTLTGKHFDLHMVLNENPERQPKQDTFYWMASLAGFPHGPAVAPLLGSSHPDLGILSTQYIGGLTAWDKIREFSEIHRAAGFVRENAWKKIFVRAFTVIFKAWHHSGYQIVPGAISPANVSIPEMDFRESAVILSLAGWSVYKNTLSLVSPMVQDYYCKTASIYPWCKKQLNVNWIFEACVEALGVEEATQFLEKLLEDLKEKPLICFDQTGLGVHLKRYLEKNVAWHHLPVSLFSAIDQYADWYKMNPLTASAGKEQTIGELMELYKLHQHPELIRYYFFRHTYFCDASGEVRSSFDKLLARMQSGSATLAIQLIELSDLQSTLTENEDKAMFSKMVFPRLQGEQQVDFLKIGENTQEHVVVRFNMKDKEGKRYILREAIEPKEIGQLYQLFFRENYPKEISDHDHQYIVTDQHDRILGGLTWRLLDDNNVLLDGIVVTAAMQGRGIASAMMENFFTSMAARGVHVVKAHFLFGNYYFKNYFEVDKKWGALIKTLK
jgi:long-subunit acyl-CoA synthetase (AMP-forming)/GNAT superfamily N-acetyltransferase